MIDPSKRALARDEQTDQDAERFDDLLYCGLQDDDAVADGLELDDATADELAEMRAALGSYKSETLRFAQQQSSAMPVPHLGRAAALWAATPRWTLAATALVALGCTTMLVTHRNAGPAPVALAAAPTQAVLNDDNRLLLSVDQALNSSIAPTEEDLGLTAMSAHPTRPARAVN